MGERVEKTALAVRHLYSLLNQELLAHVLPGLQADLAFNLTLPAATPPGLPGILETLGRAKARANKRAYSDSGSLS